MVELQNFEKANDSLLGSIMLYLLIFNICFIIYGCFENFHAQSFSCAKFGSRSKTLCMDYSVWS